MKKWFKGIFFNRYFLLFMMLFAYVQSIYIRITSRVEINAYTFTPEAVLFSLFQAGILFVIMLYFIKKFQKLDVFSAKEMLLIFGLSLVMFLLVMKASGLLLAFAFGTFERNFNQSTFSSRCYRIF